jgi:hypothetical protein
MLGTGARVSNVILKLMENKVMMQKSQEGRCFIEAQSSVHQRSSIIEVGRKISMQSHVLKNDLNQPNYRKSLISDKLRWDLIGVHWIAETSRTLEIRSLLANIFDRLLKTSSRR